ncbi:MAG: HAD family phosphatase [Eubacteriales bacterium]|nr:HAD family phosphatase [Eubacteriales bacterium]
MLKAVIFDMDGTLLDSEIVHYFAIRDAAKEKLGIDIFMENYMRYCGVPDPEMWPEIMREAGGLTPAIEEAFGGLPALSEENREHRLSEDEKVDAVSAELERIHWAGYHRYIEKNGITSFPGVPELLDALKKAGLHIAIATGSLHSVVEGNLQLLGIKAYVDAVAASEDVENGKPAPDVFLKAAEFLGVEPAQCLVVEDSRNGLTGAARAGMAIVGFDGSQMPSEAAAAPFAFSDYRQVRTEDFYRWYAAQKPGSAGL